jgi:DNA-binding XRE family transcriptional regulator
MKREWLSDLRNAEGLSQEKVANMVGVQRTTYVRYESGARTPKPDIALKIAHLFNFDPFKFFYPIGTEMVRNQKGA